MSGVPQVRIESQCGKLADLEKQLQGHVYDAIDFDALYRFEQLLWGLLDHHEIEDEHGELAKDLIVDAVLQVVRDPASYFPVSPPPGITEAEVKAVEFDEDCPFCKMEAEHVAYEASPTGRAARAEWEAEEAELVELYASSATQWREQHAAALKRAGLH
jgi:hypothetical protein